MAYQTGTATNMSNFIAKVVAFATANGWTNGGSGKENGGLTSREYEYVYLKSTGFSGTDDIVVSLQQRYYPSDSTWKQLKLDAYTKFATGVAPSKQTARSGKSVFFAYPDSPAIYHLMVNKERIQWIIYAGGRFSSGYVGYMHAFSPRSVYPQPYLLIGNTYGDGNDSSGRRDSQWGGNEQDDFPTSFLDPSSGSETSVYAQWAIRTEGGEWLDKLSNSLYYRHPKSASTSVILKSSYMPYGVGPWKGGVTPNYSIIDTANRMKGTITGKPVLYPVSFFVKCNFMGEIWGNYMPMGGNIQPGDTITQGGKTYLVTVPKGVVTATMLYLATELS